MTQPRLVGGRYELDRIVGRGGMAEVFRACDTRLNRIVGVKTLRSDLARHQMLQARFRREAQSAASLNHPSIVAVYDTGEEMVGGTPVPYIVMEFVDGRTLTDLLRDERRLLPERAARITCGVLTALDYSHRNGIVHRDIKPSNVMLTRSGEVKVMDFGLARAVADSPLTMSQPERVIGTAHYMSPEQASGERADARSDLYSTGCLLYELLTGRLPFVGESPVAIVYQHVQKDPVPPSQVTPEVPLWADVIVLKALQKDPARRYQSAAEMRNDIQRALAGAPVAVPKRKTWPWVTLAVLIAVLTLAVVSIKFLPGGNSGADVPSVTGMSLVQAEHAITGAGLRAGKVSYTQSAAVAKNDVISTNPPSGRQVSKGSAVSLVVSKGRHVPVASHPRSRHTQPASPARATPAPSAPARATPAASARATPAAPAPSGGSPAPSPTQPSPSPSTTCVVNILGICL